MRRRKRHEKSIEESQEDTQTLSVDHVVVIVSQSVSLETSATRLARDLLECVLYR